MNLLIIIHLKNLMNHHEEVFHMKQKTAKKLLIVLLSLALALGLMPGMRLTAHAANTTWSESFTAEGRSIHGGVTVSNDITVTIPEGVKLSVYGGIDASGRTLTVEGGGTLNVMGVPGGRRRNQRRQWF